MPRLTAGLCAGLALIGATAAHAETNPEAQRYLASAETREAARLSLKAAAERVMPPCASYSAEDAATVVYKPLQFTAGLPDTGLFRESATVKGCGISRRISVLALVKRDGSVKRIPLLPGTTLGDPIVQRDAVPYAISGAAGKVPDQCRDVHVQNTDFIGYDAKSLEGHKPWREIWTIAACQATISVDMLFRPDAEGTTIIARPHRS